MFIRVRAKGVQRVAREQMLRVVAISSGCRMLAQFASTLLAEAKCRTVCRLIRRIFINNFNCLVYNR